MLHAGAKTRELLILAGTEVEAYWEGSPDEGFGTSGLFACRLCP
jgi:hypothetical protein